MKNAQTIVDNPSKGGESPLLLVDVHHAGYVAFGFWGEPDNPQRWTALCARRVRDNPHYKMGINLGAASYEMDPELAARMRKWMHEDFPGRVTITGGDYAQPTACVRSGESNLRHLTLGLKTIKKLFGVDVDVWTVSEPGNFAQLPQILNDLGYKGALMRIHGPGQGQCPTPRIDKAVVYWVGPDGSRIKAVPEYFADRTFRDTHVLDSQFMMLRYKEDPATAWLGQGDYDLGDIWNWKEKQAAKGISPVVMSKDDDHGQGFILCQNEMTEDTAGDPRFRWLTVQELFEELPEPTDDFVPDFNHFETRFWFNHYGYEGNSCWHHDLAAERALDLADFSCVMASRLGFAADHDDELDYAWKRHLMGQSHDVELIGNSAIRSHFQTSAKKTALQVADQALKPILASVQTEGKSLVLFNSCAWDRNDYVEAWIPAGWAKEHSGITQGGATSAWDVIAEDVERTRVGFSAKVPAMGYTVVGLIEAAKKATDRIEDDEQARTVTTPFSKTVFAADGGIESITTGSGLQVVGPGSMRFDIRLGEERLFSVPVSLDFMRSGASVLVKETGKIGADITYSVSYRFTESSPRIDVEVYLHSTSTVEIDLMDCSAKLRASLVIPESLGDLTCMRQQPFLIWPYNPADVTAAKLPCHSPENCTHGSQDEATFASLCWADLAGDQGGAALLYPEGVGYRYDVEGRRIEVLLGCGLLPNQSLMRYRPLSKFSILPRAGDWKEARVHQFGVQRHRPVMAFPAENGSGVSPAEYRLAPELPANVTVSSIFHESGGDYLRLFEHEGTVAELPPGISTKRVNLRLEPFGDPVQVAPRRIAVIKL